MIDIISLEKVLLDLIKVINNDQLECFKIKIFEILNLKNTKNINKNNNICNYPRSKNRGPCKRRCINSIHCIYHKKQNTPKEYINKLNDFHVSPSIPDNIPCNKYHIPQLLEYNELDDSNQYKKIKLDKNIKVKSNNCIFIEDIPKKIIVSDNFHVNHVIPDNIPCNKNKIYSEDIINDKLKKTTKNKKKKKRYLQEYKKLCNIYNETPKKQKHILNIKIKSIFNNILDYEKNKIKSKEQLTMMLKSTINNITENVKLENEDSSLNLIISYIYVLANVFEMDNYNDKDFLEIKDIIDNTDLIIDPIYF